MKFVSLSVSDGVKSMVKKPKKKQKTSKKATLSCSECGVVIQVVDDCCSADPCGAVFCGENMALEE